MKPDLLNFLVPQGFEVGIDLESIRIWFRGVYSQCRPDFESLLNEKLSTTFGLFTNRLLIAASATLNALEAWIKLLFYLCRLIIHIILMSYPYIRPVVIDSYNYWNSLDLTVQLSIIGFIVFIIASIWIKKNHYIGRTNTYIQYKSRKIKKWFTLKWHQFISWISIRSKMSANMVRVYVPHLIWWITIGLLIWFIPEHTYASHHVLLFIGCFVIPTLKTYSILRKYTNIAQLYSDIDDMQYKIHEYIDPLQSWLQFWCGRASILFTYYLICYLLSYIPTVIVNYMNDYIDMNSTLFAILCDWCILWLLVIDSSLSFFAQQLTTKIFQFDSNIRSQSQERTKIRSSKSLADKISLSSLNSLLSLVLRFIYPFVPTCVYSIIHDGLYQFLIFFTFLFFSPRFGSYILGYLWPIYTSILALNDLTKLQQKVSLWNNNRRNKLITPHRSPKSLSDNNLRARNHKILSPTSDDKNTKQSWSLWSLMPLNMFSFHGAADLSKNERKREEMHNEANYVIKTIADRLKYWVVFASFQWIYYFIGEQIGLQNYIPLWNYAKFALILWMQLPYVPYNSLKLYEYVILPFKILDIHHMDIPSKKNDDTEQDDEQKQTDDHQYIAMKARGSFKIDRDNDSLLS